MQLASIFGALVRAYEHETIRVGKPPVRANICIHEGSVRMSGALALRSKQLC